MITLQVKRLTRTVADVGPPPAAAEAAVEAAVEAPAAAAAVTAAAAGPVSDADFAAAAARLNALASNSGSSFEEGEGGARADVNTLWCATLEAPSAARRTACLQTMLAVATANTSGNGGGALTHDVANLATTAVVFLSFSLSGTAVRVAPPTATRPAPTAAVAASTAAAVTDADAGAGAGADVGDGGGAGGGAAASAGGGGGTSSDVMHTHAAGTSDWTKDGTHAPHPVTPGCVSAFCLLFLSSFFFF